MICVFIVILKLSANIIYVVHDTNVRIIVYIASDIIKNYCIIFYDYYICN